MLLMVVSLDFLEGLVLAERFFKGSKLYTVSSVLCSKYCEVHKLRGESRTGFSKKNN